MSERIDLMFVASDATEARERAEAWARSEPAIRLVRVGWEEHPDPSTAIWFVTVEVDWVREGGVA